MISRRFTTREKILMVIMAVVVVAAVYIKFIYLDVSSVISQSAMNIAEAQDELDLEQAKYAYLQSMKEELADIDKSGGLREIPDYDNSKRMMEELNQILLSVNDYTLTFLPLEQEDTTVRRKISLNFKSANYATAEDVVKRIYAIDYRCLITSLSISADKSMKREEVDVTLEATFFEKGIALKETPKEEEPAAEEEDILG